MRTMLRGKVTLLFMMLGLLLAVPAVALADIIHDQVNNIDTNANETVNLVEGNTTTVKYWIERVNPAGGSGGDGDGGCNVDNGEQLYIKLASNNAAVANALAGQANVTELTVGGVKGLYVGPFTACDDPATVGTLEGVKSADIKGLSVGSANFSVTVPASGATGTDANNATVQLNTTGSGTYDVTTDGTFTVNVAAANTAPTVPGVPTASSNPNKGVFNLDWVASDDDDKPDPPAAVTYTLQHKDSDDANFSNVATSISGNSYSFTAASPEAEGTWTYQVKASDGSLESAFSSASSAIKVDKSAPSAPVATTTPGSPVFDGWFKDTVKVSYSGSTDPALLDTSAGSGVASYNPADESFSASGTHDYSGTATDNAGNVSAATTGQVKVDTNNPTFGPCPTAGPFLVNNGTQSVGTISAFDADESGVNNANSTLSGTVNTGTLGPQQVTFMAKDNVGHEATTQCSYNVIAHNFIGFSSPVDNAPVLNTVKAGQGIPLKWRLMDASGNPVTNLQSVEVKASGISCALGTSADQVEEVASGSSGLQNLGDGYYQFNWKSPTSYAKSCKSLQINGLGMQLTVQQQPLFQFTR
jgi:hypothetical protein